MQAVVAVVEEPIVVVGVMVIVGGFEIEWLANCRNRKSFKKSNDLWFL